ncbi:MAG: ABC transporter substrate-binding protein [Clostridia bacterium]|nr:ABC transporter substrate-binding protein [Clostridia bacterium]
MKKLAFLMALMLMPIMLFTGCGEAPSNKIVLSEVTHSIFYAPLYIAMSNDYFKDEGLEVELVNGNGSNNVMTSLISGSATIGLAGPETAVYTAQQTAEGAKSPKVFGQLTACDGSFLVGRTADSDFTLEDLRGKTIIAGRRGGMPAMTLEYALAQNGMVAGRDYTLNLDYDFGMVATVFESGVGDYCTMFEPVASDYVADGNGAIVASIGELGGYVPYTAFIANEEYLENNALQAEQFLRAVYRGYLYLMNANIDDVVDALMPQFAGSNETSIKSAVENYKALNAFASSPVMTQDGYDRLCAIITAADQLEGSVAFDKVIDNTIAQKVVKYFSYA